MNKLFENKVFQSVMAAIVLSVGAKVWFYSGEVISAPENIKKIEGEFRLMENDIRILEKGRTKDSAIIEDMFRVLHAIDPEYNEHAR
mgnify:CR=1 FL=1